MDPTQPPDVTELLSRWNSGDEVARESIVNAIYGELTSIATRHLAGERHAVELQPHALVHDPALRGAPKGGPALTGVHTVAGFRSLRDHPRGDCA